MPNQNRLLKFLNLRTSQWLIDVDLFCFTVNNKSWLHKVSFTIRPPPRPHVQTQNRKSFGGMKKKREIASPTCWAEHAAGLVVVPSGVTPETSCFYIFFCLQLVCRTILRRHLRRWRAGPESNRLPSAVLANTHPHAPPARVIVLEGLIRPSPKNSRFHVYGLHFSAGSVPHNKIGIAPPHQLIPAPVQALALHRLLLFFGEFF